MKSAGYVLKKHIRFVQAGVIVLLAGLAYLPFIDKFGYTFDDWYLMWSAKAYGPQVFHDLFSIDRPLRAYLMIPAYVLFGENPFWYNLSAFVLRVVGALFFWRMIRILWPGAQLAVMGMALLFVVYPGFLSQPNAIDYLSHITALALALLSLMLMVEAFSRPDSRPRRFGLLSVSAILGWLYLGLMEYYIGFELIRILLVGLFALRSDSSWFQQIKKTLRDWLPFSIVPLGFVFWRVFIFVGERQATDAGAQLGLFLVSPLRALWGWATGLLNDIAQTSIFAWFVPLMQLWDRLTMWQIVAGLILASLTGLIAVWISKLGEEPRSDSWRAEAFWLGGFSIVAGLIPVVLANRGVEFPYFSRYTLISSTGVALMMFAVSSSLPEKKLHQVVFSVLLSVSVLTHFANSVNAANETAAMRDYWWQVAWRAPMLAERTTIVAQYPAAPMQEDYFIWGPANLIYYPFAFHEKDIQPVLFAALPTQDTLQKILDQERQEYNKRRNIITYANYRNVLLIVKPTSQACIRILGPDMMDISRYDSKMLLEMMPYSEIERVLNENVRPIPPYYVFGEEPEQGWCYYYQKASLARQYGDWQRVLTLGREARAKNLSPYDEIEWLPFLQAEALFGEPGRLAEISAQMTDGFSRQQACLALNSLDLSDEIVSMFCASE